MLQKQKPNLLDDLTINKELSKISQNWNQPNCELVPKIKKTNDHLIDDFLVAKNYQSKVHEIRFKFSNKFDQPKVLLILSLLDNRNINNQMNILFNQDVKEMGISICSLG